MSRRERKITAAVLLVLAIASALWIHYVLWKEKPENIAAFANRFVAVESLDWTAQDGAVLTAQDGQVSVSWAAGESPLSFETAVLPVENCKKLLVNATIGGTRNAKAQERWGFRVWMELHTFQGSREIACESIEIPFETEKSRSRIFAVEANAQGADGYQVRLRVEPMDGKLSEGSMSLQKWEVYAR